MSHPPFPGPRLRPAVLLAAGLIVLSTAQRAVLCASFAPPGTGFGDLIRLFAVGFRMDLATGIWALLAASLWLALIPDRWFAARWHRRLLRIAVGAIGAVLIFGAVAEWFFFQEFDGRFNAVAVDYLLYPKEVATTMWQDYPAGRVVAGCAGLGWVIARVARGALSAAQAPGGTLWNRLADLFVIGLAWAVFGATAGPGTARGSGDRVRDELAGNGTFTFVHAFVTRRLDHPTQYVTLPRHEAVTRVRRLVAAPGATFMSGPESANPVLRRIAGDPSRPRRNVVVILVESLGAEFVGVMGARPSLTPRLDALAAESILFTNVLSSGDRTQRGLEGVLSSFPPLPGASIYRRPSPGAVETLASVLKRDGYRTLFCYGGDAGFDSMRPFLRANGFDRVIERRDYAKPAHVTVWGVSDEDLLFRALDEMNGLHRCGASFCAAILTVSNHKPFTYPAGRIPERPEDRTRTNAVRYTDWALGEFFRRAQALPLWRDTIFAVIADHGPRVYGRPLIPLPSYRIPLMIAGPAAGPARRVGGLTSSLDVAPTMLGLIGRPYVSTFFGRDVLTSSPAFSRAPVGHHRDAGLLTGSRMPIASYGRRTSYWRVDPATLAMRESAPDAGDREAAADLAALLQVADELIETGRYGP